MSCPYHQKEVCLSLDADKQHGCETKLDLVLSRDTNIIHRTLTLSISDYLPKNPYPCNITLGIRLEQGAQMFST